MNDLDRLLARIDEVLAGGRPDGLPAGYQAAYHATYQNGWRTGYTDGAQAMWHEFMELLGHLIELGKQTHLDPALIQLHDRLQGMPLISFLPDDREAAEKARRRQVLDQLVADNQEMGAYDPDPWKTLGVEPPNGLLDIDATQTLETEIYDAFYDLVSLDQQSPVLLDRAREACLRQIGCLP